MPDKQNMRQLQYDKTRHALIDAGLEVFVRKGYEATTVREIARTANVSPGLLFHYFSSKAAILNELMVVVDSGLGTAAKLLQSKAPPLEIFTTIAEMILTSFSKPYYRHLFLLTNQLLTYDAVPAHAKEMVAHSRSVELSASLIAKGQSEGIFKTGDPLSLSLLFWGALQGVAELLMWKPDTPVPSKELFLGILVKG